MSRTLIYLASEVANVTVAGVATPGVATVGKKFDKAPPADILSARGRELYICRGTGRHGCPSTFDIHNYA